MSLLHLTICLLRSGSIPSLPPHPFIGVELTEDKHTCVCVCVCVSPVPPLPLIGLGYLWEEADPEVFSDQALLLVPSVPVKYASSRSFISDPRWFKTMSAVNDGG